MPIHGKNKAGSGVPANACQERVGIEAPCIPVENLRSIGRRGSYGSLCDADAMSSRLSTVVIQTDAQVNDGAHDGTTDGAPSNTPPEVNAGPDLDVPANECVVLSGQASDDGLPNPPGTLSVHWSQVGGPGVIEFAASDSATVQATFPLPGEYQIALSACDGAASATDYATVAVHSAQDFLIPYSDQDPVMDGVSESLWRERGTRVLLTNVVTGQVDDSDDLDVHGRLLWTDTGLWVMMVVSDNTIMADSDQKQWEDDSIEIYIDGGADRLASYGPTDYQYVLSPLTGQIIELKQGAVENVQWVCKVEAQAYSCEFLFPWNTLQQNPTTQWFLGIDLAVNDDDDGGKRDAHVAWWGTEDTAWQDPRTLALARLDRASVCP